MISTGIISERMNRSVEDRHTTPMNCSFQTVESRDFDLTKPLTEKKRLAFGDYGSHMK